MTVDEAIRQVAKELDLPYDVCHKAYMSSWKFILDHIQALPLSADLPVEEFRKLRPNFNVPSLGKFYVTEDLFKKKNEKYLLIQKYKELKHAEDNKN